MGKRRIQCTEAAFSKRPKNASGSGEVIKGLEAVDLPDLGTRSLDTAAGPSSRHVPTGLDTGPLKPAAAQLSPAPKQACPSKPDGREAVTEQPVGRRSARKHTKWSNDGKPYQLGRLSIPKDAPAARAGMQSHPCYPAPAAETKPLGQSDCPAHPSDVSPADLKDAKVLQESLSREKANQEVDRPKIKSGLLGSRASNMDKPCAAAEPASRDKAKKKRRPSQKAYKHTENSDPCSPKDKALATPQKPAVCARSPLSPRQETTPQGTAPVQKLDLPAARVAACLLTEVPTQSTAPTSLLKTDPDWFSPTDQAKVQAVEEVLSCGGLCSEGSLPLCRDSQANELLKLVNLHLSSRRGGSIYISGLPGTGKSLTTHEVARQCWQTNSSQKEESLAIVSINCMSLKQPGAVFSRALAGFQAYEAGQNKQPIHYAGSEVSLRGSDAEEALKEYAQLPVATPSKKGKREPGMLILILDELDQLRSQDCSILYTLFGLPQAPRSRLVLIGISNSIDIVERRLPRLKEMGTHPHAVPFPSYSIPQIRDIIRQRLAKLPGPAFQEPAIAFCARKIASQSGDMRRALEACSVALSNAVAECSKAAEIPAAGADNHAGPVARRGKLVGIGDMAKAILSLQGGAGEGSAVIQAMRSLPQQQQLVLCAASKLLGQAEPAGLEPAKGPTTPQSQTKVPRPRMASFMSPGYSQKMRTPTGKGLKSSAPRTPGSAQYARLSVLGNALECPLGVLHESYSQLCKQVSMKPLNSLEFAAACSNLADMGIMGMANAREERLRKISLKAHKDDIVLALQEARMLRNLLCIS